MSLARRVLLVEDHDLVRLGTGMLLESLAGVQCEIVACRSLEEARTACRERAPIDLVLLDLNLSDSKGLQGLSTLRGEFPGLAVALLTGTQDESVVRLAMKMGATGYLLKSWPPDRLKEAFVALLKSGKPLPAAFPKVDGSPHWDRVAELGERHLKILELILEGCSNQEISRIEGLSLGTVKNYVSSILLALDVDSRSHLQSIFR